MKLASTSPWLVLALALAACESSGARGPAPSPRAAPAPVTAQALEEQVKQLSAASHPGPRHAVLDALTGHWDVVLAAVAPDGAETELFSGSAALEWNLGKRFLRWDATIEFGGTPGTTTGFLGYDGRFEEYQLLMISDLAQGMEVARGTGDLAGQGLVFTLEQLNPRSALRARSRSRLRLLGRDHFVLEQLEPAADGDDRVTRVWHYRRAAGGR